jgi:hypothetical protein
VVLGGLYLMHPTPILAQKTATEISKAELKMQSKIENAQKSSKR